jgi:hypothetical protein
MGAFRSPRSHQPTCWRILFDRARRAYRCLLLLGVTLALAACTQDEAALSPKPPGFTGRRWVGIASQASCPDASSAWAVSPVFTFDVDGPEGPLGPLEAPAELSRYCLYEWRDPAQAPGATEIDALHADLLNAGVLSLAEDGVVVGPSGDGAGSGSKDPIQTWIHDEFQSFVGNMPVGSQDAALKATTLIAVIDSSPDSTDGTIAVGPSGHGYAMAWFIQRLTCPSGAGGEPCLARTTTRLALPHTTSDIAHAGGGFFGTEAQLAAAIYRAIEHYRHERASSGVQPPPRLVVNISVASERQGGDGPPDSLPAPTHAVLDVLRHASCQGAIVIAAAGNDPGGTPAVSGPMFPAALASRPAPSRDECDLLEGPDYDPDGGGYPLVPEKAGGLDNPLVWSVGGVDYAGHPITKSRASSFSKLAAPALHGVAEMPESRLESYTGTSVAAAITSGVAAAVAAYRPEATAPEIMDIVHRSGSPLTLTGASCATGDVCAVRQVSLCKALEEACPPGAHHPHCPAAGIPCVEPQSSASRQNPPMPEEILDDLSRSFSKAELYDAPLTASVAPSHQYRSLAVPPWVHPQPERPPCGACALKMVEQGSTSYPATLYVSIKADYPLALEQMTLTLTGFDGGALTQRIHGPLGPERLGAGDRIAIDDIDLSSLGALKTATLSWLVTDPQTSTKASVSEQILITDVPSGYPLWSGSFGHGFGLSVAVDNNGDVLAAGGFFSSVDFGGGPLQGSFALNAFVAKMDEQGEHVWSTVLPIEGFATDIAVDSNGDVFVVGRFGKPDEMGSAVVARIDSTGEYLWSKNLGEVVASPKVAATQDGVVVIIALNGGADVVVKLDKSGNTAWSHSFKDGANFLWLAPHDVAVSLDGSIFITGTYSGTASFGAISTTAEGDADAFMVKLDPTGSPVWSSKWGSSAQWDVGMAVAVTSEGNAILVGVSGSGSGDLFLVELDSTGAPVWSEQASYTGELRPSGVTIDSAGDITVAGVLNGVASFGPNVLQVSYGDANGDAFVAKLDRGGDVLWAESFGDGAGFDAVHGIVADRAGHTIVTGAHWGTMDFGGSPLPGLWSNTVYVAKLRR